MSVADEIAHKSARTRPVRPLEIAHLIAGAIEEHGVEGIDVQEVAKRAVHVGFGINAEHEFAVLAVWLGYCDLVHLLDQPGAASSDSSEPPVVPDMLIRSSREGRSYRFAVEVKTSFETELKLSDKYLHSLLRYGEYVGMPVLVS